MSLIDSLFWNKPKDSIGFGGWLRPTADPERFVSIGDSLIVKVGLIRDVYKDGLEIKITTDNMTSTFTFANEDHRDDMFHQIVDLLDARVINE